MKGEKSPMKNFIATLHEFEEAVKRHEHRSLFGASEVVKRQEVDRARKHVVEFVEELLNKEKVPGA
jgi:hypothetical protein